jgi:hypothetical protein
MKPILSILTCLTASLLLSCKEDPIGEKSLENKTSDKLELSTDELLQLMGGELYEVVAPDDIKPENFAGLGIRSSDGSIRSFSGTNHWKPGEVARVVCFRVKDNTFEWAISRNGDFGRGSSPRFPVIKDYSFSENHKGLSFGEMLVRFSTDETITLSDHPQDDDFDIIFHILNR